MLWFRRLLMVGVAGVVLVGPPAYDRWDFEIAVPYGDADDPFTDAALRARMERIAPLVAEVVGSPLDVRDVRIASGDPAVAAERHLYEAFPTFSDLASETHAAHLMRAMRTTFGLLWSGRMAAYTAPSKSIAVYASAFEAFPPADLEGLLDLVLAHELVHLWQDREFQAFHQEGAESSSESDLAHSAAIEGSAEFVSREVMRRLGSAAIYDKLAAQRKGQGENVLASVLWPYLEGLSFVEALHAQLGPTETWRRLLREPPRCAWDVEHPHEWLAQPSEPAEALEGWGERLAWCLTPTPASDLDIRWRIIADPLLRAEQDGRLWRAGLAEVAGAWTGCRGGLRLEGKPRFGPLAGVSVQLDAWRFVRSEDALEARRALEEVDGRIGPASWSRGDADETLGVAQTNAVARAMGLEAPAEEGRASFEALGQRTGAHGAVAQGALTWGQDSSVEEGWRALSVHGTVLLEATCWRSGAGSGLLDLLDTAVRAWVEAEAIDRARKGAPADSGPWARLAALRAWKGAAEGPQRELLALPEGEDARASLRNEVLARRLAQAGGEGEVLAWLQERPREPSTWLAALGPAWGHEDEDQTDRDVLLDVALRHPGEDVRRFALESLAWRRFQPSPWSVGMLASIEAACSDAAPALRVVGLRAAERLHAEEILTPAQVDAVLRDPSPAVRITLVGCKHLLGDRRAAALTTLATDADAEVRRAAQAATSGGARPTSTFLSTLDFPGAEREDPYRFRDRLGQELQASDEMTYGFALMALNHKPEMHAQFLPLLVRALAQPKTQSLALDPFLEGELDLEPARRHLLRMLDHPRLRPDVLRVLAANDLELPPGVVERTRAWSEPGDPQLRCGAALLRLRLDRKDDEALALLEEVWSEVPLTWRPSILTALLERHRDTEVTRRLRRRALGSPFEEQRSAGMKAAGPQPDEDHLDALLSAIPRAGPTAATEYWTAFLDAAEDLDEEDRLRAGELLARHVRGWCDAGRLPELEGKAFRRYGLPDFTGSRVCIETIDRCLVREGTSYLQLALALLRSEVKVEEHPEPDAVRSALDRLFTLEPRLEGFPAQKKDDFFDLLAERPSVSPEQLLQVLRREASEPLDDVKADVEELLKDHPERIAAALGLVPELLERGTHSSVQIAVEILEAARARAAPLLPRLREVLPRALPSWRKRLGEIVTALEAPPGTPWPERPKPKKR